MQQIATNSQAKWPRFEISVIAYLNLIEIWCSGFGIWHRSTFLTNVVLNQLAVMNILTHILYFEICDFRLKRLGWFCSQLMLRHFFSDDVLQFRRKTTDSRAKIRCASNWRFLKRPLLCHRGFARFSLTATFAASCVLSCFIIKI